MSFTQLFGAPIFSHSHMVDLDIFSELLFVVFLELKRLCILFKSTFFLHLKALLDLINPSFFLILPTFLKITQIFAFPYVLFSGRICRIKLCISVSNLLFYTFFGRLDLKNRSFKPLFSSIMLG